MPKQLWASIYGHTYTGTRSAQIGTALASVSQSLKLESRNMKTASFFAQLQVRGITRKHIQAPMHARTEVHADTCVGISLCRDAAGRVTLTNRPVPYLKSLRIQAKSSAMSCSAFSTRTYVKQLPPMQQRRLKDTTDTVQQTTDNSHHAAGKQASCTQGPSGQMRDQIMPSSNASEGGGAH